ncbi:MAG: MBL fold metallo-hydrolase [Opitutales bacterium]
MTIPVEDNFEDVLAKAMRGLGFTPAGLATLTGSSESAIATLLRGNRDDVLMSAVADLLELNPAALQSLAERPVGPETSLPDGITLFNTPYPVPGYEEMSVNSYIVRPPGSMQLFMIDAGGNIAGAESLLCERGVEAKSLFLTHTHRDHIVHYEACARIVERCYAPEREPYKMAQPVKSGESYALGGDWQLEALPTPGHSPGGTSYLLTGPDVPVAFVGDAIFCRSIGKADQAYKSALSAIRKNILSLPEATVICPGHGPITTVWFERSNNPFFA